MGAGKFNAGERGNPAMDSVLSRGGGRVETKYRNWDKLRADWSLGSYADVPVLLLFKVQVCVGQGDET